MNTGGTIQYGTPGNVVNFLRQSNESSGFISASSVINFYCVNHPDGTSGLVWFVSESA